MTYVIDLNSKTAPLLWVICHPFGKTSYGLSLYKIWALASAIPEIWMRPPKFKMCHVTLTTPLSGMVSRPSAGTNYDQPVQQKWSLYVYSLRRYESRRKMQTLGWFGGLGVTQGHRKHRPFAYDFLFDFNRNYASILYRFGVIAHFSSQVANFNPPTCICSSRRGWSRSNFAVNFGVRKLESLEGLSCGIICVILRLAVLIQYRSVIHTQMYRQTDTRWRHILHLA